MTNEQRLERLEDLVLSLYTNFMVFFDEMNGKRNPITKGNMLESMQRDRQILQDIANDLGVIDNAKSKN